jgi:hypothetical protein
MTLYRNPWNAPSQTKKRRMWRRSKDAQYKSRANFAYGQQWKRYPLCRAILDLQLGHKTHTFIIPERSYPLYRQQVEDRINPPAVRLVAVKPPRMRDRFLLDENAY